MASLSAEEHLEVLLSYPPELLLSAIAHDLRAPLSNIWNANMLVKEMLNEKGCNDELLESLITTTIPISVSNLVAFCDALAGYASLLHNRSLPTSSDKQE